MKLLLLIAIAVAVCVAKDRVFPEYREMLEPKAGWTVKFTNEKPLLSLTVALKQKNTKHLKAFFEKVSDPRSSMYGKYKSLKEMNKMVAPSRAHVKKVTKYFKTAGFKIDGLSKSGDFLNVRATPAVINAALKTDMQLWHNKNTGGEIWRALTPYSFPASVGSKIDFVSGVHHFPNPKKGVFLTPASTYAIGPTDLRTRYNVTDFASGNENNTQAVAEFQGQYYSPSDLETFFEKYVPGNKNATVAGVVGPNLGSDPGVEAELDIQYIMGVNPGTATYFYSQQSFEFFSDLTNWITILNDDPSPPLVHSISYGEQKEHQTSSSYKSRFETEMQKLGSRGLSIIFASGDSGVGCFLCYKFEPSFPATSPSVTSVGATTFLSGPPVTPQTTEGAVTAFGSGGGFSWTYDRPTYQEAAVNSYIANHGGDIPSQIHWSKNGRGTPDVAALGWGFSVVVNGGVEQIGGTSAAAPTFSAIISLLNDQQLKAGRAPLGFLNPWLYQTSAANKDAFFDVTIGNNPDSCCTTGFSCAPGWDAVTGLGTPNYSSLKSSLPGASNGNGRNTASNGRNTASK